MQLTLTQRQTISQTLVQHLKEELVLHIGPFEDQILDKIEFSSDVEGDINACGEESEHMRMLRSLVVRKSEDENSLIGQVAMNAGFGIGDVQKVVVGGFKMDGLGYDIGTKRYVNKIELILKDGRALEATVSMDREYFDDIEDSPSAQEADALEGVDVTRAWCVQRVLGVLRQDDGKNGQNCVIVKEMLPGEMLVNYGFLSEDLGEPFTDSLGEKNDAIAQIALAVGRCVGNAMRELSGIPRDSNPMNFIVGCDAINGIYVRWCDVENIDHDDGAVEFEMSMLRKMMGPYLKDFERGLADTEYSLRLPGLVQQSCVAAA